MKIYTGIGSRTAPIHIANTMTELGQILADKKWILRSGAADGADACFEEGCDKVDGIKEIFYLGRILINTNQHYLIYHHMHMKLLKKFIQRGVV